MSNKEFDDLYIGEIRGEWPLQIFPSSSLAMHWLQQSENKPRKRLYYCEVKVIQELELVEERAYLTPKEIQVKDREGE